MTDQRPTTSVVITTYNWPWALERVLVALTRQTDPRFDVVIADDGSGDETREMLDRVRGELPYRLIHAWHEDRGFRRAESLNNAVRKTDAECLIFTDQDSLPAANWVEGHRRAYRPFKFVVGGYVRLTREQSEALGLDDVRRGVYEEYMTPARLRELRRYHLHNLWSLAVRRKTRPRIMGLNFSVARDLFVAVNGFDHEYVGWGKEDSDLRCRMRQAGAATQSVWHRSFVYHLWHESHPSKKNQERNKARYLAVRKGNLPRRCARGLVDEALATPEEHRETEGITIG